MIRAAAAALVLTSAPAEAGCLSFTDIGLGTPESRPGLHRLSGEIRERLARRAGMPQRTQIWAAHGVPYLIVTLIYVRGACPVRSEQMSLKALIEFATGAAR